MLKQPQKKIMSVKDFTNRLTFLSNALEECARMYENSTSGDRIKRTDTRDGFGMLLFCPPKPTDDHQKLYDNIVCHWFYRQELSRAQIEENAAQVAFAEADTLYAAANAEVKAAGEALSKAKQQLGEGESSNDQVAAADEIKQAAEGELAEARAKRSQAKDALTAIEKRCASHQKELDRLIKERTKTTGAKCAFHDFEKFANAVREANGLPALEHPDPEDPACFDGLIGLPLQAKEPTPTDVSRLRTDASNSTILNEFVVSNNVVSPAFAAAGFPPCRTSLIRDTDPAFQDCIIEAARNRIMRLIAEPELSIGLYESAEERALLLETLGIGKSVPREFAQDAPENILFELVTSEAFPVVAEEMLKPAVIEGLTRFGDETACEDFARKLAVLSYDEQLAREAHARALDGLGGKPEACYALRLKARGEMLALMLSTALLGASGVEKHPVSMENIQKVVTGQPNLLAKKAGKVSASEGEARALLVEQIPNQQGSFSFGKSIPLESERGVLIGRAPFGNDYASVIVPAGISPYPGLANFAANVSRAHALLEADAEGWRISDAGSSYGTAVKRLGAGKDAEFILLVDDESLALENGDVIVLAPVVYDDGSCDVDVELGFTYRFEIL